MVQFLQNVVVHVQQPADTKTFFAGTTGMLCNLVMTWVTHTLKHNCVKFP